MSLKNKTLVQKKGPIITFWETLDYRERLVFNKILIGGFRLGVSQNLIVRALSNVSGIEANVIAHRLMGDWSPESFSYAFILTHDEEQAHLSRPYPFCLAHPLDKEIEHLGDPWEWAAEWKWDGIRGQVVFRENVLTLWSRGEEMVNDRFPELVALKKLLPQNCVIDGEILAFKNEKIIPFQYLQQRIGRKKIIPSLLNQIPVIFIAYDLLEWEGEDWREKSFDIRRQQLEKIFPDLPKDCPLHLSELLTFNHWDELKEHRQRSRLQEAEGIMLKKKASPYHVGRKKGDWWKWKVESYTVDAVLIYAQKGHGWRANIFSDILLLFGKVTNSFLLQKRILD